MSDAYEPRDYRVRTAHAQAVLDKMDLEAIVIIGVGPDGTISMATSGTTSKKRVAIDAWALWMWKNALRPDPFETVFGTGNNGKPKPLAGET